MHADSFSCVIIADDLTGACDTACIQPSRAKFLVHLDPDCYHPDKADVHAFNADTRDMQLPAMQKKIERIANVTSVCSPVVIFKKIDSLLGGNPGAEIAAAMQAFACDLAIITPAFPAMGRVVRDSHLEVRGDSAWKPIHVLSLLRLALISSN
jgi:D-threonate/D-erythronate kinase